MTARREHRVLVLHGPNLNLLGRRETAIYGKVTLEEINKRIGALAGELGVSVEARQSNSEAQLIDWIQSAVGGFQAIILNPGGLTHTSVALRDAVAAVGIPTIEVHLSNIYQREPFRQHSYIAPVAVGQISGLGPMGYLLALRAAVDRIQNN